MERLGWGRRLIYCDLLFGRWGEGGCVCALSVRRGCLVLVLLVLLVPLLLSWGAEGRCNVGYGGEAAGAGKDTTRPRRGEEAKRRRGEEKKPQGTRSARPGDGDGETNAR